LAGSSATKTPLLGPLAVAIVFSSSGSTSGPMPMITMRTGRSASRTFFSSLTS
jgi:hypothetical protein